MDNRLNIPVLLVWHLSNGVTQKARSATDWKWWSKPVGGPGRKIHRDITLKGYGTLILRVMRIG